MTGAGVSSPGDLSPVRLAALEGMAAPILFVSVFTAEGALRPGYHPVSMFVSELSLGPRGWVQIGSFVVTGLLVVLFASGVAARFIGGRAASAGPAVLKIIGFSLMASGPFVTDPSALFDQTSLHGLVHGIFGALVFSLAPVSCFVYFGRFRRDPAWKSLAPWTLLIGALLVLGIVMLKLSQLPHGALYPWKGWIQRVILCLFMGWLFAFAARLYRVSDQKRAKTVQSKLDFGH